MKIPRPMWPHHDFALELRGTTLTAGTTVLVDTELLRVIERLDWFSWRVRPTTSVRALDDRYRRRQRNRRR